MANWRGIRRGKKKNFDTHGDGAENQEINGTFVVGKIKEILRLKWCWEGGGQRKRTNCWWDHSIKAILLEKGTENEWLLSGEKLELLR